MFWRYCALFCNAARVAEAQRLARKGGYVAGSVTMVSALLSWTPGAEAPQHKQIEEKVPVATTINKTALLMHSAQAMFELVADIERYPEFLPGCSGAEILETMPDGIVARLDLSKAGVKQSFITRNTNAAPSSIRLALEDGPFDSLRGEWRFDSLSEEACRVSLDLTFQLRSGLLKMAASRLFESVANDMVDAMVKRANQLSRQSS